MLSASDTKIDPYIPLFAETGVPVAFLVPTPTGFQKSIMDATGPIRQLFRDQKLHDYNTQHQGPENKVVVPTYFVTAEMLVETNASLYRPVTKKGDPRIWIYKLKDYAKAFNLLALVVIEGHLYVFNLSNLAIRESLFTHGFCYEILLHAAKKESQIAQELLNKIRNIHDQGFLPSITVGDPGVGDTLEHALGIGRNNDQNPDYHGIELKASRKKQHTPNRSTLFTKTPDWSVAMNERQIIERFGYWGTERDSSLRRFQLYCTLSASNTNSQGLTLRYEEPLDQLNVLSCNKDEEKAQLVTAWKMQTLRERLLEKHPATFWVKATAETRGDKEYFRYDHVKYTRNPNVYLFTSLVEDGIITVDFLMHLKPNGNIRDHGFPFKIMPQNINLLFPEVLEYDLLKKE